MVEGTRGGIFFLVPRNGDGYISCSHSQRLRGPLLELVGRPSRGMDAGTTGFSS